MLIWTVQREGRGQGGQADPRKLMVGSPGGPVGVVTQKLGDNRVRAMVRHELSAAGGS